MARQGRRQEAGATSKFTFPIRLGGADERCTLLAAYCCKHTRVALILCLPFPLVSCARFPFLFPFHFRFLPVPVYFALPLHWLVVQFLLQLTFWQHRIGDFASFVSVRGLQSSLEHNGGELGGAKTIAKT